MKRMPVSLNQALLLCSLLLMYSCGSNDFSDPKSTTGKPEELNELTSFDKVAIKRYPGPIRHKDSLLRYPLRLSDYMRRRSFFIYQIGNTQKDTILPPFKKADSLRFLKTKLEELNDHAYLTALTICGYHNDLIDVELFSGVQGVTAAFVMDRAPAVGLLRWNADCSRHFSGQQDMPGDVQGQPWGSGCLIDDDLFLTAGHCFDACPNDNNSYNTPVKNGNKISSWEIAKYMNVIFNFELNGATHMVRGDTVTFSVDSLMEFKEHGIDYAIVRLKPDKLGRKPGDFLKKLSPAPGSYNLQDKQLLCIIQQDGAKVKKVGCGHLSFFDNQSVYYGDIDTNAGSSGAPVIDCQTGYLIGVHTDGNCTETAGTNYGARIDLIRIYSKYVK